jgi:hypothetical protein
MGGVFSFFFWAAFLIGRCFLWHFHWAVCQKKRGARGWGVFFFFFSAMEN